MTQAVIFDFGNVLCFPPSRNKIAYAAQFCHLSEHAFLEAFWNERLAYDAGKLTPGEYWATVAGEAFANDHLETLVAIEVDFWNDFDARPFEWIATLRAGGIRTGILSNLPRVLGEELRSTRFINKRFLEHFDHVTFSYEHRAVKPQAAIYRHAFEGLGIAPQDALFLDDKLPNVHGAIATGLQAEHFTTWEEFLERDVPALYSLPDAPR